MITYVKILRGRFKGEIGRINGTFADHEKIARYGVNKFVVRFDKPFPDDMIIKPLASIRAITDAERLLLE